MTSLQKLQENFISDCLSGELTDDNISIKDDLITDTISAKGRMSIYRESAIANITIPMEMTYPVVKDLVGNNFWEQTCRQYTREHWPTSGNMDYYGESFADFLENLKSTINLAYLPDIARLEWLFHISSLANDMNIGDWSDFPNLTADELSITTISIHPSVQLMSSNHPLLKIWALCKNNDIEKETIDLSKEKGGNILLVRKKLKVNLYPIANNEIAFIQSLADGCTLLSAYDKAINIEDNNNIKDFIIKHINIGTFCNYHTPKNKEI